MFGKKTGNEYTQLILFVLLRWHWMGKARTVSVDRATTNFVIGVTADADIKQNRTSFQVYAEGKEVKVEERRRGFLREEKEVCWSSG